MNPFDGLNTFEHTVLAYIVAVGLLWGYAGLLLISIRKQRNHPSTSDHGPDDKPQ